MKTEKLDLLEFKQNELCREDISSIKAGEPIDGKPPGASTGGGSGEVKGEYICYYTPIDHDLIYCRHIETGEIVYSEI